MTTQTPTSSLSTPNKQHHLHHSTTHNEQPLLTLLADEYEDLFPYIMKYTRNEFLSTLEQYIHITLNSRHISYAHSSITKAITHIQSTQYEPDYTLLNKLIHSINSIKSYTKYTGVNYIPHCNYTTLPVHKCGDTMYKVDAFLLCIKCKMIYKQHYVCFHCDYCDVDYFTAIESDKPQTCSPGDEYRKATWQKYHCDAMINDCLKCYACQNELYVNISRKQLMCLTCKLEFDFYKNKSTCIICKSEFSSEAKIYNPLEFKHMKIIVKQSIIKGVLAKPDHVPCCDIPDEDVHKYNFFHRKDCNGLLCEGNLNNNRIVVCVKCHKMYHYDKHLWMCPLCKGRFKLQKHKTKANYVRSKSMNNHSKGNANTNDGSIRHSETTVLRNNNNNNNMKCTVFPTMAVNMKNSLVSRSIANMEEVNNDSKGSCFRYYQTSNKKVRRKNEAMIVGRMGSSQYMNANANVNVCKRNALFGKASNTNEDVSAFMLGGERNNCESRKLRCKSKEKAIANTQYMNVDDNNNNIDKQIGNVNIDSDSNNNYYSASKYQYGDKQIIAVNKSQQVDSANLYNNSSNSTNNKTKTNNSTSSSNSCIVDDNNNNNNNNNIEIIRMNSNNSNNSSITLFTPKIINDFNNDDFVIVKQIGEGSFGKIYSVEDKSHTKYAMKKLIASSLKEITAIQNEYKMLISLSQFHLNLATIYGTEYKQLDKTTYVLYVLMDLALCDWEKEIIHREQTKSYYTEPELLIILKELTSTFAELQKLNISHRDIKPQNILVFANNSYRIADFGEAKEILRANNTSKQTIRGTELYMSPILFNALKHPGVDRKHTLHNTFKSDVFSLGLCFVLAGALTFKVLYQVREVNDSWHVQYIVNKYLQDRYSLKFREVLFLMLEVNEKNRCDFVELNRIVQNM